MTISINTLNHIAIDNVDTGLAYAQRDEGTVVFTREQSGIKYKEHKMPSARYSLAHSAPRPMHATPELAAKYPAPAGRDQFEADIKALLQSI